MKVIELFSGIGGMHFSLKGTGINFRILAAVDINTSANDVYRYNFPETPVLQRNVQSFSFDDINKFNPDMITMSPPCQPFTRLGLKKDSADDRTNALLHIITLLPNVTKNLKYIVLENVKGFEVSDTRNLLVNALLKCDFKFQEFLLNSNDYDVPSSRLRYYLIAKRKPLNFCFPIGELKKTLPIQVEKMVNKLQCPERADVCIEKNGTNMQTLSKILETERDLHQYKVPKKILLRYAGLFDITFPFSTRSCCFTKAYGRYAEGTGSVLCPIKMESDANIVMNKINLIQQSEDDKSKMNVKLADILEELGVRYFTPREIARLMCFPEEFSWPKHFTTPQMYRLLGNSINIRMVTIIMILLTNGDEHVTK